MSSVEERQKQRTARVCVCVCVCLGILDVRHFHPDVIRWSLTAHDVCFTNALHSQFFARGNCVPVVRGAGVYQRGLDFCVDLLNRGRSVKPLTRPPPSEFYLVLPSFT